MRDFNLDRRDFMASAATAALLTSAVEANAKARRGGAYDVLVVGAGVFGMWTAWQLLQSGAKVLLVDSWGPAQARASSGGETRLIRTEYRADPIYTRWAWESLADWKLLSGRHEQTLFHETGALNIYPEMTAVVDQSIAMHRAMNIPIEKLSVAEVERRWPQIDLTGIVGGLYQPTMGTLMARRSVQALMADFIRRGGSYRQAAAEPPVIAGNRLEAVMAKSGERLAAGKFVFACGPWLPKIFPDVVGARIVPIRKEVFFFAPPAGDTRFTAPNLPAWIDIASPMIHYGFPDIESRGFKVSLSGGGGPVDPDQGDRRIGDQSIADVKAYLAKRFPGLASSPLTETRVCQYENTYKGDFLIDHHPLASNVWIAGGGSGHGFKHGPAVGRYVANLVAGKVKPEPRFLLTAHNEYEP